MRASTLQLPFMPAPIPADTIPSLHFVKYMGSKRNILSFLIPILENVVPRGGRLLDLFAGTHSIGYAMKQHGPVWGNDIQHYAGMLGETLLRTDPVALRDVNFDSCVGIPARRYYEHTSALWKPWLGRERDVLTLSATDIDAGLAAYLTFIADLDAALPHGGDSRRLSPDLKDTVQHVVRGERVMPPMMAALYWSTSYFSLEQCLWLDAYRQAIEDLPADHLGRATALSCLLHAAAYCTHGTGHFAQHRKLTSVSVLEDALRYRTRSVPGYWRAKLDLVDRELLGPSDVNRVTVGDYTEPLADLGGVDAVYADPPYSFVHYSRFYHVLETLALYDTPGTEYDGRYRPTTLRHQSPFCIRSQMAAAFESVLRASREAGIPLVWSYSRSGLMPFDSLIDLCERYYSTVEVQEQQYRHATMGRREDKTRDVAEVAIICS